MQLRLAFPILYFALTFFSPNGNALEKADLAKHFSATDCLKCHEKTTPSHEYYNSSHKDLNCTACHSQENSKSNEPDSLTKDKTKCVVTFKKMDCNRCHSEQSKQYLTSGHNSQRLPITCQKCHSEIHKSQSLKDNKLAIANMCSECHSRQKNYFEFSHHQALKKGNNDAATCTDCHGLHDIAKIDNDSKGRAFHTNACLKCHDDKVLMTKNKVTNIAGESYFNSFHGKNVRLGYPEKVAGCADCHTAHMPLKAEDPKSSVHKNNIVKTCMQCHSGSNASFAGYIAHADDHNKDKFPALYWTRIGMTGLLVGTFLFFWIHSILWMVRALIERQKILKTNPDAFSKYKQTHSKKYRRFETRHIVLHLFVVSSFLALALTGLPLKFNGSQWAKMIFDFIGGASRARFIHHSAAVITFSYFAFALFSSARFLFLDKKQKGTFKEKLFGPDSLFPNSRDLKDLKGMFRWFFFMGPKPTFERWTYWEKFDFMAVFWGMFAIGISGLVLWFPEFFGHLLPGWAFNIATIIHSDEALLATGFIFTVHFFNTHFRPDKFPMDTVIFDGQISHEEMLEERGDQWKRYEQEGRTEEFLDTKPRSTFIDFALKLFGFFAVIIGLSLVVGMIVAMF